MIDPDIHRHYLALADEARASDPRWRESDELLAQASELRAMRADAVDDITRGKIARMIVKLDGKDDLAKLSKAHSAYLTELGSSASERAAARLRNAVLDEAMARAIREHSAAAQSHAAVRVAVAGMRERGAAAVSERHADTEGAAVAKMGAIYRQARRRRKESADE